MHQGSVLEPLLFVLYISNLPEVVNTMVNIYADDTKLYGTVQTETQRKAIQNYIMSMNMSNAGGSGINS